MSWVNVPPTNGADLAEYDTPIAFQKWVKQFPKALQERRWATGPLQWPPTSFVRATGAISSITDNGDGTYTLTDGSGNSYPNNKWGHQTSPPNAYDPTDFDLVIDFPFDETKCVHFRIISSTGPSAPVTFVIADTQYSAGPNTPDIIADLATGGFIGTTKTAVLAALVGGNYSVIRWGGIWWHERWLQWPNDQEKWVGMGLVAGALQPVATLTSSGTTTATAVTSNPHQFITGDSVTIAGAVSTNRRYNGTFTVIVTNTTTFTYTIGGLDGPASGTITAANPNVGATDPMTGYPPAVTNYPSGAFATGCQLMVKGSDGALKRITLTGNDKNNLYFTRQSYQVSGQYAVVSTGNKWRNYNKVSLDCRQTGRILPGANSQGSGNMQIYNNPQSGSPFAWYDGPFATFWSRNPSDTITSTIAQWSRTTGANGVVATVGQKQGMGCGTNYTQNIFDQDYITSITDVCNSIGGEICWTPGLFRTIHGWQLDIENVCTFYVPMDPTKFGLHAYQGSPDQNGGPLLRFTPATLFYYCGINSILTTSTGTGSGSTLSITAVPSSYVGPELYWTLVHADGTTLLNGTGHLTNTTTLIGDTFVQTPLDFTGVGSGTFLYLSKGWTRKMPMRVMYVDGKSCWLPDLDTMGNAVDPPTSTYPGSWVPRLASSTYKESDVQGGVRDSNGTQTFATNDVALYTGDNFGDPSIHTISGSVSGGGETTTDQAWPLKGYYDNFYDGTWAPAHQLLINAAKSGTATSGTATQITDATKNWWALVPGSGTSSYQSPWAVVTDTTGGGSIACTTKGTFDSGSTAFGADSSKVGDGFWQFSTAGTRWQGEIVNIYQGGIWYKRRIENYQYPINGTKLTFDTFDPMPASVNGNNYNIREGRYEQNRWGGRSVKITRAVDGSIHTTTIAANDDQTLFLNAALPFTIQVGDAYQIIERGRGVYQWNGSAWVQPTGIDTRTNTKWRNDPTANAPSWLTRYGKVRKDDDLGWLDLTDTSLNGAPRSIWNELYTTLQALMWVGWPFTWANPGNNYQWGGASAELCFDVGIPSSCVGPQARPDAKTAYAASTSSHGGSPFALSYTEFNCFCYTYDLGRLFAEGSATGFNTYEQKSVDFWVFGLVPNDLHFGGSGQTQNASCPAIQTFDAMGDPVLYNQWNKFDTQTGVIGSATSIQFGSLTTPTDIGPAPTNCSGGPNDCTWVQGYTIANYTAVARYNVASGFVYQ